MILKYIIFAILAFANLSSAKEEYCCWEKCFKEFPKEYGYYVSKFYHLVEQSIAHSKSMGVGGTGFALDNTVMDLSTWQYERDLAALLALTLPVDEVCNPFCINKYMGFGETSPIKGIAYSRYDWQCKNQCEAAMMLNNIGGGHGGNGNSIGWPFIPMEPPSPGDWLSGGDFLSNYCFENEYTMCYKNVNPVSKRRLMVDITNSEFFEVGPGPFDTPRIVIGIDNSIPEDVMATASEDLYFNFQEYMSSDKAKEILNKIVKCIKKSCCYNNPYPKPWPTYKPKPYPKMGKDKEDKEDDDDDMMKKMPEYIMTYLKQNGEMDKFIYYEGQNSTTAAEEMVFKTLDKIIEELDLMEPPEYEATTMPPTMKPYPPSKKTVKTKKPKPNKKTKKPKPNKKTKKPKKPK